MSIRAPRSHRTRPRPREALGRATPRLRPAPERLEAREVPVTFPTVPAGDVSRLIFEIVQADQTAEPSTIVLTDSTYDFGYQPSPINNDWFGPNYLPPICNNVTIDGNGAVLRGTAAAPARFFFVSSNVIAGGLPAGTLTLKDLTLEAGFAIGGGSGDGGGGLGAGGAIFNMGSLTLDDVTLDGNAAIGGSTSGDVHDGGGGGMGADASGGGMGPLWPTSGGAGGAGGSNGGTTNGGGGGGFASPGGAASGKWGGFGGGLSALGGAAGLYYDQENTNSGGLGGDGGGGAASDGQGHSDDGSAFGVGGIDQGGGGVGGGGGAQSGGGGFGGGGGADNVHGAVAYSVSAGGGGFGGGGGGADIFSGAKAGGGGFGGGDGAGFTGGGGAGLGGAIFNLDGSVALINCTLAYNAAIGGTASDGVMTPASNGDGYGGAIFNLDGSVSLTNTTIAHDIASTGAADVYNLAFGATPAAAPVVASLSIANDILSDGPSALVSNRLGDPNNSSIVDAASVTATGPDIVLGYQALGGATTVGARYLLKRAPKLGLLGNNGGTVPTMALLAGSPAINAGKNAALSAAQRLASDARGAGFNRVINRTVDLGAYEYQPPATTTRLSSEVVGSGGAEQLVLTARVAGRAAGSNVPQGRVDFAIGGEVVGSAPLVDGQAVLVTTPPPTAMWATARYTGYAQGDEVSSPSLSARVKTGRLTGG